jgi:hypothetical protein
LYFGFPEDGALALKQVRILYVMYDVLSFYVHLLVIAITCKNNARSIYREYTKEWCGVSGFSEETAPFFCVCPV